VADVRYEPDNKGWKQIRNSSEISAACVAVAKKAQAYAESISPRDEGEYVASFDVEETTVNFTTAGDARGPRAAAELRNTADHAAAVEWGKRPHRVLGRTLDHLDGSG
jgi:hypothetical protein